MRNIIQLAKWLWAYYSFHFTGAEYRDWQCEYVKPLGNGIYASCRRMKHHTGGCRYHD